ncbi:MAG: alpha/beta hydrolase fold domain-containing protein [Candidatus Bathyarchaeia archaeon]|jgi:acetyl esterase/lipase
MNGSLKKRYVAAALIIIAVIAVPLVYLETKSPKATADNLLLETTDYHIQNSIPYINDSNPYHLMDVYLPDGDGPFPAIIYIHGGGWVEGNRSDFNSTATLYAKRGIAGFAIDYTLASANNTAWPANIQDAIAALAYIRENAALYHVDRNRIAVMGSSAGAQLASLLGTLTGDEPFLSGNREGSIYSQVCMIINFDGVEDLEYVGQNRTENNDLIYKIVSSQFGGVSYSQNPQLWKEASPVTYITAGDPTFVLIHGVNDRVVPIQIVESFNAKLQAGGVKTHFIKIDGDHDILTNDAMTLQARGGLDPLLRQAFNLK